MKIAFVGKGGSGKTTLAALCARHLAATGAPLLALDADINQHLAAALGAGEDNRPPQRQEKPMSLDVPTTLQQRAEQGTVDDGAFVACVRDSLPYAWHVVSDVADRLADADPADAYVDHAVPPPSEAERGQLLRALASDAIRGALERHFGVGLAFQNCHRVAAFRPDAVGGPVHAQFVSPVGQLRNQSPELRDC